MQLDKVVLEEIDTSSVEYMNEISMYFTYPSELAKLLSDADYSNAEYATICVKMVRGDFDSIRASISPTVLERDGEDECYTDIDYRPLPESENEDVWKLIIRTLSKDFS